MNIFLNTTKNPNSPRFKKISKLKPYSTPQSPTFVIMFGRLEAFRYFYELFKRKALLCYPAVPKTVGGRLLMENRCTVVFNLFGLCFVDVKL
ncbi:hypothetical protein ES319_D11G303800v1 [Gossypium barbadense]|uniref:Uncharacterized protein n=2 Tax=Gossypium TaxID=3633 RepID=A0A5J5PGS0_GOSBA|nr:hypothetical protein ES319_D11G303800v1 [Gossypium barbadense]TYG47227.1 hypothetical protein ES288_D11G321700v1 [Gossypium darwinii]